MTGRKGKQEEARQSHQYTAENLPARPAITVDYEKYEHFLETADLSDEQKREFIAALWSIIVAFVDLGFGVHPAQQAEKTCGKLPETLPKPALTKGNEVKYQGKSLTTNWKKATDFETEPVAEGVET